MAAPIANKIILPDDSGNTGKKVRTQTRVVGADTVHEHFFVQGRRAEGRLVGYVGHYNPVKGVDTLIRAFKYLSQHFDDCRLVLAWSGIGDPGPIERAIADIGIGDRVLHLGRTPIGALLSALDVLALPYRLTMGQSAYPGLLLEALGVGVALVTSDLPLLREIVEHNRTALLVPPDDTVATATAISTLLENRAIGSRLAAEQRSLLRGPFSPPHLAKQYVQLYRQVCSGKAPARTPLPAPDNPVKPPCS